MPAMLVPVGGRGRFLAADSGLLMVSSHDGVGEGGRQREIFLL